MIFVIYKQVKRNLETKVILRIHTWESKYFLITVPLLGIIL